MTKKKQKPQPINMMEQDAAQGGNWLAPASKEVMEQVREEIRAKNRAKYLEQFKKPEQRKGD